MSFASTASTFGNTSNTNQFGQKSLFAGSQPATTNIFGSTGQQGSQQPTGQSTNLFGQQGNTGQQGGQQPTGNLFGQQGNTGQQGGQQSTGNLFGQQGNTGQQGGQQSTGQSTNLFGQPSASNQPTFNLFGQTASNSQPASNLFGNAQSNLFGQQSTQPGTNLFGQQTGQSTTSQPTTGLFGGSQQSTMTQPTNSLFGQQAGQPTTQPTTGLFGQQAGQSTTQPTTGLFGQQAGQSTTQPTTGLFGQPATSNIFGQSKQSQPFGQSTTGAGTPNIFGQNPLGQSQQQQQPSQGTTNLFGGGSASNVFANIQTQSNPSFSTTLQRQPQQQPFGSTSQASGAPFTKSTKFNDLPDEVKKTFEQIETLIQGRVQISKDLQLRKLGQEATKGQDLVRTIHQEYVNTANTIKSDLHLTQDLKKKVNQAVQDTIIATRIVDGFKNPQSNGFYLKDHAAFPLEYFTRVTEHVKQKLAWYQSTVEQIERKLSSLNNQAQYTPQGIAATLQAQHATFLALAGKTAHLDAELQKIKTLYTQLWRAKTGSVRDPFNALDMDRSSPSLGMSAMQIR